MFIINIFLILIYLFYMYSVIVPMGGSTEVYTSLKQRRKFNYANVRKASYRGNRVNFK